MMQRQIEMIGAAWGLGGADPGCAEAPAVLVPLLAQRLAACGVSALAGPILEPSPGERRKQFAVSRLCAQLAAAVAEARRRGRLPCVIGGDHSCAGGTWTGVARTVPGALGLVWIDAHMDSHTPATSHTGRLHGMPLAWLLGQDDDPLYGLGAGVLEPKHVCLVGVRSYEPEEDERLRRLGVRVIFMDEVRSRGIDAVLDEALDIATAGTSGFGVSIDLDVVTPEEAPNVGTPVAGGVTSAELARALQEVAGRPALAAIELVEYSPRLDRDGLTGRVAIELLGAALCGPRQDAQVVADAVQP
ncbi:MAG TPA: arginase [Burkholderiales bacterium]|nr:arginase [Burkholderiales bacterium]